MNAQDARKPGPSLTPTAKAQGRAMNDKRQGETRPVQSEGPAPRMPHERDESSDSQTTQPRGVMRQAHEDLAQGRTDTDRGVPMNEAYQRQKTDGAPAPGPDETQRKT